MTHRIPHLLSTALASLGPVARGVVPLAWPSPANRAAGRLRVLMAAALLATAAAPQAFGQGNDWDLRVPVAESEGDAEEFSEASRRDPTRWPSGFSYLQSSDLELAFDPAHGPQIVGLRFSDLKIEPGDRIESAVVVFTSDSSESGPLQLRIGADANAEPDPFVQDPEGEGSADLSSRTLTSATVAWQPDPWRAGEEYHSSDLSPVLQELIDRPDWRSGGEFVLLIAPAGSNSGELRSAFSFDASPERAPRLLIRLDATEEDSEPPRAASGEEQERASGEASQREEAQREEPRREETQGEEAQREEAEREEVLVTPVVPEAPVAPQDAAPNSTPEAGQDAEGGPDEERAQHDAAAKQEGAQQEGAGQEGGAGREAGEPGEPATSRTERTEPGRARFALTPNHGRGVRGSVLISDYGFGSVVVTLLLNNPDASATYAAAIHTGSCGAVGSRVASLESLSGARSFSSSLVPIPFEQLVGGDYHVDVRRTVSGYNRVAGCAALHG